MHLDLCSRITAPLLIWQQLQAVFTEVHGVIHRYRAHILEADDHIETHRLRQPTIRRFRLSWLHRKLGIEAGEIGLQDLIGLLTRPGSGFAQFDNQPILQGPKQTLSLPDTFSK
jgi:hypothetical protein